MALILCPRCRHLLAQDNPERQGCGNCGGIYVHLDGLRRLLKELRSGSDQLSLLSSPYREAPHQARPKTPEAPPEAKLRYLRCPHCSRHMNRVSLAKGFNLVLDYCLQHGVWFDPHELSAARAWLAANEPPPAARERANETQYGEERIEIALTIERLFGPTLEREDEEGRS